MSELRLALVHAVRSAHLPVAEAARRFGVSRKTAFKWLARHDAQPDLPLLDRSRRPQQSPRRTNQSLEQLVLETRDRWGWGPRKLHALLRRQGHTPPPVRTIAAILKRHGRIRSASESNATLPQRFERATPNELWQLDFKGPLEVARQKVTPLSVLDDHSRYLLALHPCTDMTFATVQGLLWNLFGDVGLPDALLCDNAFSTAKNSRVGLTSFEAWLIRLGIRPAHGRPYHPQTQGKIERFHGTLERELWPHVRRDSTEHFAADLDAFRPVYNTIRPHEALGDEPPVCRWRPSDRRRPPRPPQACYPPGSLLRRVGPVGDISYRCARIMVGRGLAGENVRIAHHDPHLEIFYCDHRIRCLSATQLKRDTML
ncbi:MAG TPA: IS481 family transposase [Thermomicrobiales bacterium]|nr:IS481 family transposase [Thermomicrobiales bacterium]